MLRNIYSLRYSEHIFTTFINARPRGWVLFRKLFKNMEPTIIIDMFRFEQKRWNIFKKVVKLVEILDNRPGMDLERMRDVTLTYVKQFTREESIKVLYRDLLCKNQLDKAKRKAQILRAT